MSNRSQKLKYLILQNSKVNHSYKRTGSNVREEAGEGCPLVHDVDLIGRILQIMQHGVFFFS